MKRLLIISFIFILVWSVSALCYAKEFKDVTSTEFAQPVNVLTELGIVDGYEDGTYRPKNDVTRAEMAKLIIVSIGKDAAANSLKGKTQFNDVVEGGWASGYINCAVSQGIIKGYPDGTFKPNNKVTYAEAATMVLRALNYTKELEKETYPTGYMSIANKIGLLKNVKATKSSDNSTRGYIATMLFNGLKAYTRKIVSTGTNGTVNYGDGIALGEQYFENIKCVKDGQVVSVDFEEAEIVVKDNVNNRKLTIPFKDEKEIKNLYLRKVDLIFNSKTKALLSFEIVDSYTIKEVEVERINKGTIYSANDEEYELPDDDDVLMQYITNYGEADTAFITYDGKKMLCVVLEGTPKIYPGIVNEIDLTISKRKAIEITNIKGDSVEYALSDTSQKLKVGDFILYSLDNDEYIVIRDRIVDKDADIVEELTASKIKLKNSKNSDEFTENTEYYVYLIKSNNTIKEVKLADINVEFDLVYTKWVSDVLYVVVFQDGVSDEDIVSTLSVSEARSELKDTVAVAKKLAKKETEYSVETFEPFYELYIEATYAIEEQSSAARLEVLNRKLNDAMDALESSSSEDRQLRKAFTQLQSAISEAETKRSSDYTKASFSTLTTELKNAQAIKLENTTLSKVETRLNALNKAINMLVTVAADKEIQENISELKYLISVAEGVVKQKDNYTTSSYNNMYTALTNAKKLNTSTASLAELKNQVSNLEGAIDALVLKSYGDYQTIRHNLDDEYDDMMSIVNSDDRYTSESYAKFVKLRGTINSQYKALPSISEVATMSAAQVANETKKASDMIIAISNAEDVLVSSKLAARLESLSTLITKGEAIKEEDWHGSISYAAFKTKLANYKKYLTDSTITLEKVNNAILDLSDYIS